MDIKKLKEIQTPKHWINDALNQEKAYFKKSQKKFIKKSAIVAIACLICTLIMGSVIFAISQNFQNWLINQFLEDNDTSTPLESENNSKTKDISDNEISSKIIQPEVTKLSLPAFDDVEDSFLIENWDTKKEKAYCIKGKKVVPCDTKTLKGCISYQGKDYNYSIQYVKEGKKIHSWNRKGAIVNMIGYSEDTAIVWLETGNLWNSYYINIDSGELTSIINENNYKNLLSEKYYWDNDGVKTEGYIKLAIDVQVSPDGSYLLFSSNRDCLVDKKNGEYQTDRIEWYVKNLKTGEETKLEDVPWYLHTNEIGFIDDSHISISMRENSGQPALYDCSTKEMKDLGEISGSDFGNSLIYDIGAKNNLHQFKDLLTNEIYEIPISNENEDWAIAITNRTLICMFDGIYCKGYLIKEKKSFDFEAIDFYDIDMITHIIALNENQYLFLGVSSKEEVGYLLEI